MPWTAPCMVRCPHCSVCFDNAVDFSSALRLETFYSPMPPTFDFAAALSDGTEKNRVRTQKHQEKVNKTRVVVTRTEVASLSVLNLKRLARHPSIQVSAKYVTAAVAARKGIAERTYQHVRKEILDAWPSSGEPITLEPLEAASTRQLS